MLELQLSSVDVHLMLSNHEEIINVSPNEAMAMMFMPALAGVVSKLVPQYSPFTDEELDELSKMPKEGD